jgi:carboxymethylenebutenolidase
MIRVITIVLVLACGSSEYLHGQDFVSPETLSVRSGTLILTALLWHPSGPGPFPALIFSHGNYASTSRPGSIDSLFGPITLISSLGPLFARNGYLFLVPFRRGVGLSKGQGESSLDLLDRALKEKSQEERNTLQVRLLETVQLEDMISAVKFLRSRHDADSNRVAVIGHSFGGSLALLLAEHDSGLKAVVDFAAAAYSWNRSPQLRARLTEAVTHIKSPVLFIHAKNDYSTAPADSLGALMDRLKKEHSVKIYPPFGNTSDVGHNFIFFGMQMWERVVLQFLDESLRP